MAYLERMDNGEKERADIIAKLDKYKMINGRYPEKLQEVGLNFDDKKVSYKYAALTDSFDLSYYEDGFGGYSYYPGGLIGNCDFYQIGFKRIAKEKFAQIKINGELLLPQLINKGVIEEVFENEVILKKDIHDLWEKDLPNLSADERRMVWNILIQAQVSYEDVFQKLIEHNWAEAVSNAEIHLTVNLEKEKDKMSQVFGDVFPVILSVLRKSSQSKGWRAPGAEYYLMNCKG